MKRITVVFLAAALGLGLTACGLGPDETVDQNGNVVKISKNGEALVADGTTGNVPGSDNGALPPAVPGPDTSGNSQNPFRVLPTTGQPGSAPIDPVALPQDPIPLVNPALPFGPPGAPVQH